MLKSLIFILLFSSSVFSKEIRILEIDTGVGKEDNNGHGSHIAGIIMKNVCPEVHLISCKYYDVLNTDIENFKNTINCFKSALTIKPYIINYSSGGSSYVKEEFDILKELSDLGIIIVVAAGNDGKDLSKETNNYYPAKYNIKNLIPVGNLINKKKINPLSNYGLDNMVWELGTSIWSNYLNSGYAKMTGTSQSAGARTNRLLKGKCMEINK